MLHSLNVNLQSTSKRTTQNSMFRGNNLRVCIHTVWSGKHILTYLKMTLQVCQQHWYNDSVVHTAVRAQSSLGDISVRTFRRTSHVREHLIAVRCERYTEILEISAHIL